MLLQHSVITAPNRERCTHSAGPALGRDDFSQGTDNGEAIDSDGSDRYRLILIPVV
jgi:hypothetical protein